jgi:extracellular factor (EF) 3-hydroxypalmitic acid methyl ester biosynthesis protein
LPPALQSLLDQADARLAPDSALATVQALAQGLRDQRLALGEPAWGAVARQARGHRLLDKLREDPLTDRALCRPRGYPGDAVTLDYMYGGLPATAQQTTTRLGRAIFAYTAGCSATAVALRQRRNTLSLAIDETAATVRGARVLAVGCGHLREARLSRAVAAHGLAEIVALDSDRDALRVVAREHAPLVRTEMASAADLAAGRVELSGFDLVYVAGTYERIEDGPARAVTATLLRALAPGGRLLLTSFVAGFLAQEYMQAFMDWTLFCRDERALLGLVSAVCPRALARARTWRDATGCIAWLELTRPR